VISKDVKEMVFQHVWQVLKKARDAASKDRIEEPRKMITSMTIDIFRPPPLVFEAESWEDTSRRRVALDEALGSGAELQEAILTCHILTDMFLLCSDTKDAASSSTYAQGIKALSDYMVFLLAVHPDTIIGLEQRYMYESARKGLEEFWVLNRQYASSSTPKNERFASFVRNRMYFSTDAVSSSIIVRRGLLYAKLLLDLVDKSNPDKSAVLSSYKRQDHAGMDKLKRLLPILESSCRYDVFDVPKALGLIFEEWVRLLIIVSVRRSRDAHAGHINRGSDLTTVVWLMVEHAAVFLNPHDNTEDGPSSS
jgi:hypothetical protein